MTKECRKAKCVWWQHPENNCPDQLADPNYEQEYCTNKDTCTGDCSSTNCDCVEWYHQVSFGFQGSTMFQNISIQSKHCFR